MYSADIGRGMIGTRKGDIWSKCLLSRVSQEPHVTSELPSNEVLILKARAISGSRVINVTEARLQDSL